MILQSGALEPVAFVLVGDLAVGQFAGFIGEVELRLARGYPAQRVDHLNVANRMSRVLAALQVDLVRRKHAVGLRDNRVAGYDKAVGLVVVNEFLTGDGERSLMLCVDE